MEILRATLQEMRPGDLWGVAVDMQGQPEDWSRATEIHSILPAGPHNHSPQEVCQEPGLIVYGRSTWLLRGCARAVDVWTCRHWIARRTEDEQNQPWEWLLAHLSNMEGRS